MSISKRKLMISISFGLNVIFIVCLYLLYQENTDMKKGVILQYAIQQNEVLLDLETAINHQDDKVDYVNSLVGAYANIYHNFNLTKKYASVGGYVKIPDNINKFNSPMSSSPVGYSLSNSVADVSNDEMKRKFEIYTSYVSQVVNTLDLQNKIIGKSLREQYKTLNEVSDLIDEFNLEK
ncbi:hypothetical protein [Paenibacillus macquariensis]|uniref:Uncharacterized protein n=1 Tax=Paenibacillus macquariensis TaxID=948756 RepID=A0ABY1K7X5_9BACL|nr:hypothetical protein [Paenibacillus macquariensis]MEC0091159.1 hypothetical protein [Paenibacillus macquariensis]OAB33657.1 hypothetical protein PMSM_13605 [Paenibacillus macquariensis subsp. macquariensis]SIR38386.1 hypothetical protein SAMN05421578_112109 [Paenibacillus macquariensis]